MKRIVSLLAGMLMSICLVCPLVVAQTTAFTYQGALNTGGSPANGNHDFEFALFDLLSGGAQLGSTLTRSNVVVTNGVFSVSLDFGNQFPGANRFLEVRVRPSGGGGFTTLSPRQQVNSSPYSVVSLNSNQLGGIAANQYLTSGAAVINAGTQFNIGGERVLFSAVGNLFTGQGAGANTGGFGVIGNSFFGTVAGDTNVNGIFNTIVGANADVGSGSLINATAIGARALVTQSNSLVLGSINGVNNCTPELNCNSVNVGIGTTAPARRLHVSNGSSGAVSISTSDIVIEDDASAFQHFLTPDDAESGILFGDPAASIGGGFIFNNAATNNGIQFRAGGNTTRMTLAGSGDLGIGTTAPSEKLEVKDGAVLLSGAGSRLTINNPNNQSASVSLSWGTDAAGDVARIRYGGNGSGSTNGFVIQGPGDTNRLKITNNGSLVVGTQGESTSDLFVNGTLYIRLVAGAGSNSLCSVSESPLGVRVTTCSSSARYKNNIANFNHGLDLLNKMRPVTFNWKNGGMPDMGLVAEEVAQIEPLLTTKNDKGEIEGVKYDRIGVVAINAIKEQQQQLEAQQKEIESLKATVQTLQAALCEANPQLAVCKREHK